MLTGKLTEGILYLPFDFFMDEQRMDAGLHGRKTLLRPRSHDDCGVFFVKKENHDQSGNFRQNLGTGKN